MTAAVTESRTSPRTPLAPPRLRVLLLADDQRAHANTIHDHIHALRRHSRHEVTVFNPRGLARSRFLDPGRFDVVVVHYSLVVCDRAYLAPWFQEQIAAFPGLKIQFIQDEYRWVDSVTAVTRAMGVDVLFSLVPQEQVPAVYGDRLPGVEILTTHAGYVPDDIVGRPSPDPDERPIDVGYRARPIPYWLGRLGQEKVQIAERFLEEAPRLGLRVDIAWSEQSRLYGARWHRFLSSCRATLGVESGASITDHDGSIERATRAYLAEHPAASFDETWEAVLAPYEGRGEIRVSSPRVFEAAAFRSALLLYPGEYSGTIEPWRHYIPLEKDFSNVDDAVAALRDTSLVRELTTRAYDDLIASGLYSYRHLAADFDAVLDERAAARTAGTPRQREAGLRLEETSAGRGYALSYGYVAARVVVHRSLELRLLLGAPHVRRLLGRRARPGTPLWDDLVRLSVISAAQRGTLKHIGTPFRVVAHREPAGGRLVLHSRASDGAPAVADVSLDGVREIVWSHEQDGGIVWMPFGPKKLAFEVGRRGLYGIHSFAALLELARERPAEVEQALRLTLSPPS